MEVLFLGTSAATSVPLAFCRCAACSAARKKGGRDLRRRASVLIDGELLIDMGPDYMTAAFDFGFDSSGVRYLLQTHSHSDHFDAGHMITRIADYAAQNVAPLTIAASRKCLAHMSEKLGREESGATLMEENWRRRLGVKTVELEHGDRIRLGKYEIIAVESAHDADDGSIMYIVRSGKAAFFYACDTPLLTDKAWALLEKLDFQIDAAAIDQCYGPDARGGGHMCAEQVAQCVKRLGCKRAYATHISHEGTPPHGELEKWTRAHGYETAWDGLRIFIDE